jgi:hypothetical protein
MKYHLKHSAPFFFKRYVAFNKNATLEPLYHFDHVASEATRSASVTAYNQEHHKGTASKALNQ